MIGRAILPVTFTLLEQLFQLPNGYEIIACRDDPGEQRVEFLVESEAISTGARDRPLPQMWLEVHVDYLRGNTEYKKITVTPKVEEQR
jgi:hypothetical protein